MGKKAFDVSADPDQEVRDQEELDYNLADLDHRRFVLDFLDKATCSKSNKKLRKEGKHKITLPDFKCLFSYRDYHTHKIKRRSQLPTSQYSREQLEILCKNKRIQWNTECLYVSGKKQSYFFSQPYPFVVLDIDDVVVEEVARILKEKWTLGLDYSLAASSSGEGTHLHIWLDLSMCPAPAPWGKDPQAYAMSFRLSYRHEAFTAIKTWVAKSIESQTPLKIDATALNKETIAVTPEEIGTINAYWATRKPVKLGLDLIKQVVAGHEGHSERKNRRYLKDFIQEFDNFLNDPDPVQEVLEYLQKIGIEPGKREYYEQVIRNMQKSREDISRHWAKNLPSLWWLRTKQAGLSVSREKGAMQLFGFISKKNLTYVRHVAMYIWCLAKTTDYIIHRRTNLFSFVPMGKKYFKSDFLLDRWYAKPRSLADFDVDKIAAEMGNGKTWQTICEYSPSVRYFLGHSKGLGVMLSALEMSSANNKVTRRDEIVRFFSVMSARGDKVRTKKSKDKVG